MCLTDNNYYVTIATRTGIAIWQEQIKFIYVKLSIM